MELAPARTCRRCGLVGNGKEVCSGCGATFHSQEPETALNPDGKLLEKNSSLTPPEFQDLLKPQNPLKPDETRSPADYRSVSDTLPPANDVKTGPADSIPPSDIFDEPYDSALSPIHHPIFWGRGRTLFGIFIVNTFFSLLTLGPYSFWGRVRIRQFLCSQTSFAKTRFSYHGTGQELLKGWSKVFIVFGLPYAFLSFIPFLSDRIPTWIPNVLAGTMVLSFIPIAVVGSHRYRLSRTKTAFPILKDSCQQAP